MSIPKISCATYNHKIVYSSERIDRQCTTITTLQRFAAIFHHLKTIFHKARTKRIIVLTLTEERNMTDYDLCINNTARHIRSSENLNSDKPITAFDACTILAIAFCKDHNEVIVDLIRAETCKP